MCLDLLGLRKGVLGKLKVSRKEGRIEGRRRFKTILALPT